MRLFDRDSHSAASAGFLIRLHASVRDQSW